MKPGLRHWLEINLVGMNEYWEDIQQIEILFKQNRTSGDIQKRVYYGTTASVAEGSRPSTSNLWTQYVLTLGYSFNRVGSALVLTSWAPVYVKAAPQADGSAIIDADTPFVQELPSTADGMIYIFLGIAVSETTVEMTTNHPVYCYRNGGIQKWTGVQAEINALKARIEALESALNVQQ